MYGITMDDCVIANWDQCPEGKVNGAFRGVKVTQGKGVGWEKTSKEEGNLVHGLV